MKGLKQKKSRERQEKGALDKIDAGSVFVVIGWFLVIHLAFFVTNQAASLGLRLSRPAARAMVVMASQKTFPITAAVISYLPDSAGDKGLMLVAAIICQQSQLFTDSFAAAFAVPGDEAEAGDTGEHKEAERGQPGDGDGACAEGTAGGGERAVESTGAAGAHRPDSATPPQVLRTAAGARIRWSSYV